MNLVGKCWRQLKETSSLEVFKIITFTSIKRTYGGRWLIVLFPTIESLKTQRNIWTDMDQLLSLRSWMQVSKLTF